MSASQSTEVREDTYAEEGAAVAQGGRVIFVEPKWTSALALIMAGIALGLSIAVVYVQAIAYHELEREVRLQQLKVDEFRMALITAHIDPNPHVVGESK